MGDPIPASTLLTAASSDTAPQQTRRNLRRLALAYRPAALALLCGLALTAALFLGVSRLEQDKADLAFQQRVHSRVQALKEGIDNAMDGLRAVNQLFASRADVSRTEFSLFTQPMLERYPFVHGVSYARRVPHAERAAFEAALARVRPGTMLAEMQDGVAVRAAIRDWYTAIDYIEPLAGNEGALGLDIAYPVFNAHGRQQAIDTGEPSAGPLVQLAQGPQWRRGVIVSMPVYAHGAVLHDAAARRAALRGETSLSLWPADMIAGIYRSVGLGDNLKLRLRVYAGPEERAADLMFEAGAHGEPARGDGMRLMLPHWLYPSVREAAATPARQTLEVGGRSWLLLAQPYPQAAPGDRLASLSALALGTLLSILGAVLAQTLAMRNADIRRRVQERTGELAEVNRGLLLRQRAIDASTSAIVIIEALPHSPTAYVNPAFERLTGYAPEDVLGRDLALLLGSDREQAGVEELKAAIREQRHGHMVLRCYRKDGALFWNEVDISPVGDGAGGAVTHYVAFLHDVTTLKAYETELHHQAMHDALTGLPNRLLLQDRLRQTIAHSVRKGHALWVVTLDLDRFKFTNSQLGHKGGDRLLQAVAERLQQALRPVETVARLGGDEFALMLLPEPGALSPRVEQLQRVLDTLHAPLVIDNQELFLSCSAGIAVYPADGQDAGVLVERADIAMYRAKERGGNHYQFYTASMNEQLGERMLIEGALRTALERNEFVLHYQPQVDIASGRIVGMEALIRWQHPQLGRVAPNRFIPLAEETGLILALGAWVLREACAQLQAWRREGNTGADRRGLRMAVNVSARQLAEPDFVALVASLLADSGLPPACLELELTESQVMEDVEQAITVMHALKQLGVKLAIDDFGTGYSSLAHLKRFEIDVLKIDQTFVRDVTVDPDDAAIVTTIIALAANLKLDVISEGVETLEQLAFLRQHGCQQMQGYYFSRPLPAAAFALLLADNEGAPAA